MTDPTPVPAVLTGPQKAFVGAILSTIGIVLGVLAPFAPEPWRAFVYAAAGLVAVIGVPWGVYVTVNQPKV